MGGGARRAGVADVGVAAAGGGCSRARYAGGAGGSRVEGGREGTRVNELGRTQDAQDAEGGWRAVGWVIAGWGVDRVGDVRRRTGVAWGRGVGAGVVGGGGVQLLDGVLNHKILGIHQIRYGVDLLAYDVVWIGTAVVALVVGLVVLRRARPARAGAAGTA